MELDRESAIVAISCMEVRALNADYLEGGLGLETYKRVDAHLEHCRHCSAIYDGILNVISLLGSDELFQVPDRMESRLNEVLTGLGERTELSLPTQLHKS